MPDRQPAYIWTDPTGLGRNRWALFRHTFSLPGRPAGGVLHLFADTRYRLIVNGRLMGHGPARFLVRQPEYDTWDLAPVLRTGRNAIAVVVNSAGCVTFHSEKSIGGLIAWGEAADADGRTVVIATDESWRALESPGHHPETPALSFALNPAESLDARAVPADWTLPTFDDADWPPATRLERQDHWGPRRPRSIPMLDERKVVPAACLGAWAARQMPGEDVHSLALTVAGGQGLHTDARVAAMTFVHSPRRQVVTFGAWWGRYWVNAEEVKPVVRKDVGLRQDFTATFEPGWNTLLMYETLHWDYWDFFLALPRAAGLAISAEKAMDSPDALLIGGPWQGPLAAKADRLALPLADPADLPGSLGPWRRWPRDRHADSPIRDRAWSTFERIRDAGPPAVDVPALARRVGDDTLALLLDFGTEVLGRPALDFEADAGTVVDLTYSERLREDGVADVHHFHLVDMAERYVARAGRQQWQTFHPRGFRYLEVLLRGNLDAVRLHEVALTRANYPVEHAGDFACSDPVLTEVWRLGRATQHACMEDAYLDCPWRERGLYSGDFLVQFFVNLAAFGDVRLFRRCIELFLEGQGENGLVGGCAHGVSGHGASDYSMVILQALRHYWARTGDVEFLRGALPRIKRLIRGLESLHGSAGDLVDGTGRHPYIDIARLDKAGVSCALNCFQQRAFADAARVLEVVGEKDLARACAGRAERLAAAIRRAFWDERREVFVDRLRSDAPETGPSVHANALALGFGIASEPQTPGALRWLVGAMRENFRTPEPRDSNDCNVSSYFSFYALGALYRHGLAAEAEAFMRTYWGRMLERGAWTCWEYFADSASRCHAWSASPTHYLSTEVLGVGFPEPGNPNRVAIRPRPGTLAWARGVYPHPAGPIRVSWRRENGRLALDYEVPPGVEVVEAAEAT